MDRTDGETFTFRFTTRAFATGIPTALAGSPVLSAMEDAVDTPFTTGVSLTASSVAGLNLCTIDASQADFEDGKEYDIYLSAGTVAGVSVVGEVVGHVSLSRSAAVVEIGTAGAGLTAINLPNQTMDIIGDITGSLSGSVGSVTAEVTADMTKVSGDATAADNLELMYDGTGYIDDTAPASRDQVANLSVGAGGISATMSSFTATTAGAETNSETDTTQENGVLHIVPPTGGALDIYYEFDVGGNGVPQSVEWTGYVQANGDSAGVYFWNWDDTAYEQVGTISGANGTNPVDLQFIATIAHVGTGANLGKVRFRFESSGGTVVTNVATDRILVTYAVVVQSVGYANGSVWVDTASGAAGTVSFVNGVADNPSNSWASSQTIAGNIGTKDYHIINGSGIVLDASVANRSFFGDHWTLDLSDEACGGLYCQGATVKGAGTSAGEEMHFEGCDFVEAASVQQGHFDKCGFASTLTMTTTDDYDFHNCYSKGDTAPVFTKTAGQTITAEFQNYAGDITVNGLQAGDTFELGGFFRTISVDGSGGTVHVHGHYETVTDLSGGSVTIAITGAIQTQDVADILVDTTEIGAAGAGLTAIMTTAMAESYAADGVAPTPAQAFFAIMQQAGEFAISGTTITVKKLDGSATAMTFTLDDASDPTSRTRAS